MSAKDEWRKPRVTRTWEIYNVQNSVLGRGNDSNFLSGLLFDSNKWGSSFGNMNARLNPYHFGWRNRNEFGSKDVFGFNAGVKSSIPINGLGIEITLEQDIGKDYPTMGIEFKYHSFFSLSDDNITTLGVSFPFRKVDLEFSMNSEFAVNFGISYNSAFTGISINTENAILKFGDSLIKNYNDTFWGRWYDEAMNSIYRGRGFRMSGLP